MVEDRIPFTIFHPMCPLPRRTDVLVRRPSLSLRLQEGSVVVCSDWSDKHLPSVALRILHYFERPHTFEQALAELDGRLTRVEWMQLVDTIGVRHWRSLVALLGASRAVGERQPLAVRVRREAAFSVSCEAG